MVTSSLPRPDQYHLAVQNPRAAFSDPDLQGCTLQTNPMGLPVAYSGGFAITYRLSRASRTWALRCFYRPVPDRQARYEAISRFLSTCKEQYFVEAEYQPEGIRVNGARYPIMKMAWVSGDTLNTWVGKHVGDPAALTRMAEAFRAMISRLERLGVAHGDLQHGNILANGQGLKLVDYDAMFVPALKGWKSSEIGQAHYQHPVRSANDFDQNIDRFSAVVIYLALRAVALKPSLWQKYAAGAENMLFQSSDFVNPDGSPLLSELDQLPALADSARAFRRLCRTNRLSGLPSLEDFLQGKNLPQVTSVAATPRVAKRPYPVLAADDVGAILNRLGERLEVVGYVTDVYHATTSRGRPVFINFGNWRRGAFSVVVWQDSQAEFGAAGIDFLSYMGRWISVTGVIDRYLDRPEIAVRRPLELEVLPNEQAARDRLRPAAVVPAAPAASSGHPLTQSTPQGAPFRTTKSPPSPAGKLNDIYKDFPTTQPVSRPAPATKPAPAAKPVPAPKPLPAAKPAPAARPAPEPKAESVWEKLKRAFGR